MAQANQDFRKIKIVSKVIFYQFYRGYHDDVSFFIPNNNDNIVYPWKYWNNNLIKVPYFWEDDIHLSYNPEWNVNRYIKYKGIKVFDFHPIHILLNTEDIKRYEQNKMHQNNFDKLLEARNKQNHGINNFLIELIESIL